MPSIAHRRRDLLATVLCCAAPGIARAAHPPIRIIVPAAPGTQIDVLGRALALQLGEILGRTAITDARPGANGVVAIEALKRLPRDGSAMLIAGGSLMTYGPALNRSLTYDPTRDFASIGLIATTPLVLVSSGRSPIDSLARLVDAARAEPGRLTYASGGHGHASHVATAMLADVMGISLTHVPYATRLPFPDLVAGTIDLLAAPVGAVLPYLRDRQLVPLGLLGAEHDPDLPGVPSFRDAGYDAPAFPGWYALFASSGTPTEKVTLLNDALRQALARPALRDWLAQVRLTPLGGPPTAVDRTRHADAEAWIPVIHRLGLGNG
ncbi:Bug family tripartite tricarboxylate transporter substrate binding protein [Roseomonas fluvialis]|uniref:Lipoprotein n=1 Tax=Roseomonas fluvialis TaxID=1750527 RepID=A0ABM7Y8J5_9PROT|nr:tripartite tricarboxylate transporter substrate binding protein [Roseomonas fluvialis]BDG74350.1 lipoprotein [Roseomonas fluvialis]